MKRHTLIAALVVVVCLWVGCSNAFAVTFKGTLDWQTSRDAAVALARAQGKKILLVAGRYPGCSQTVWTVDFATESINPPIKSLIEQYFTPWYSDVDASSETDIYLTGIPGEYYLPLICVIDPDDSLHFLDRSTGGIELQSFYARLLRYSCAFNISPSEQTFAASSNTGTVNVTSSSDECPWTAVSNAPWITISRRGGSGTGNGTVSYSVSANTGDPRTGTMTIAGQTFTVNQNDSATCTNTISPTNSLLPFCPPFGSCLDTSSDRYSESHDLIKQVFLECHEQ